MITIFWFLALSYAIFVIFIFIILPVAAMLWIYMVSSPFSRLADSSAAVDTAYKPTNREKMAFCSKLGGLIRQGLMRNGVAGGPNEAMHLLNSARYMSTKLFVGGRVS